MVGKLSQLFIVQSEKATWDFVIIMIWAIPNIFKNLFIFREWGTQKEREGNKDVQEKQIGCFSHVPNKGTWPATQASKCLGWESNLRSFGSQADAHSTEPHQPEPKYFYEKINVFFSFDLESQSPLYLKGITIVTGKHSMYIC